ncbi:MAG: quinone oxidoreductase family protein [Acidimicrobiales bacterium]
MRAAVVEQVGQPPRMGQVEPPRPGGGQAVVEVTAAPINPLDLAVASGRFYGGPPRVPYVPGVEGVGVVVEGDTLLPGRRVRFARRAGYEGDGSMAERAVVDEGSVLEVPEGVPDALAGCLGVAGVAAWLGLAWRARLRPGERALVLGATGVVGQVGVQIAVLLGADRVVAAGRDPRALARAGELGAHATVALGPNDADLGELAGRFREAAGGPLDVVLDPLWGPPAVAAAMAAGTGARIVNLGQSASAEATIPSGLVRGKMLAILGHSNLVAPPEEFATAYRALTDHAAHGRLTVDHEVVGLAQVGPTWARQAGSPHRKLVIDPRLA